MVLTDGYLVMDHALVNAALQGHVAAFKADEVHVAGAGLLAFAATAGGLAQPTGLPPPHPLLFLHPTTSRRSQSRQLVHLSSFSAFADFSEAAFWACWRGRRPQRLDLSFGSEHPVT